MGLPAVPASGFGPVQGPAQVDANRVKGSHPGTHGDQAAASHIVPFKRPKAELGNEVERNDSPGGPAGVPGGRKLDENLPDDGRFILLFDLNGTLTSHTAKRYSAGINKIRPGVHHLHRLKGKFHLGIFSSASARTVKTVLPMLEKAADMGDGGKLFDAPPLILCRHHTVPAPSHHIQAGGNHWDTCKPLHKWFRGLHRVLLIDDDAYKALPDEAGNMVQMPCWNDEDEEDEVIARLVDVLLETFEEAGPDGDVRHHSAHVTEALLEAGAGAGSGTPMRASVPHAGERGREEEAGGEVEAVVVGEVVLQEAMVAQARRGVVPTGPQDPGSLGEDRQRRMGWKWSVETGCLQWQGMGLAGSHPCWSVAPGPVPRH
eukprot:jgi/Botrbrau1/3551/Bobra.0078s0008.1